MRSPFLYPARSIPLFLSEGSRWSGGRNIKTSSPLATCFHPLLVGSVVEPQGGIWLTRVTDPSAEAKKADEARWTALLMPNPPYSLDGWPVSK